MGSIFRSFVNVRSWISLNQHVRISTNVFESIKPLYQVKQPEHQETFDEALKRLNLSENDLVARLKNFEIQAIIYGIFAGGVILYGCYLLAGWFLLPALLAWVIAAFFVLKWGQMRFWIFQLRERKLGCRWQEWWFHGRGGRP